MLLRICAFIFVLVSHFFVYAQESGIWAQGVVSYKHPDGRVVDRDCNLWVPTMGLGQVTLSCSAFSMSTTDFKTTKENGKTIFTVTFRDVQGAPQGAVARYSGAYIRGSNKAVYYGDVYSGFESADKSGSENIEWTYAGGFYFSKDIGK